MVKLEKIEPFVSPTLHSDAELTGVAIFSLYYPGLYQKLNMILDVEEKWEIEELQNFLTGR